MLSAEQQAEWGRLQEEAGAKTAQVQVCTLHGQGRLHQLSESAQAIFLYA